MIAGLDNGKIQMFKGSPQSIIIETGDNLSRIRQCPGERKLIATGGKDRQNRLCIWDLSTKTKIFESKNLPHDSLQLEIPIWDNDFRFFDANTIATCSRYGYVRFYDIRKQRRPILKFQSKEQISFSCMAARENTIYVGTTTGGMRAFDARRLKYEVHTYKGFTGSVTDIEIDDTGKFICSSSLDRYVRVHNADSTALMYQNYIKSKGTAVVFKTVDITSIGGKSNDASVLIENDSGLEETSKQNNKNDSDLDDIFYQMEKIEHEYEDYLENGEPQSKKIKINEEL